MDRETKLKPAPAELNPVIRYLVENDILANEDAISNRIVFLNIEHVVFFQQPFGGLGSVVARYLLAITDRVPPTIEFAQALNEIGFAIHSHEFHSFTGTLPHSIFITFQKQNQNRNDLANCVVSVNGTGDGIM